MISEIDSRTTLLDRVSYNLREYTHSRPVSGRTDITRCQQRNEGNIYIVSFKQNLFVFGDTRNIGYGK